MQLSAKVPNFDSTFPHMHSQGSTRGTAALFFFTASAQVAPAFSAVSLHLDRHLRLQLILPQFLFEPETGGLQRATVRHGCLGPQIVFLLVFQDLAAPALRGIATLLAAVVSIHSLAYT